MTGTDEEAPEETPGESGDPATSSTQGAGRNRRVPAPRATAVVVASSIVIIAVAVVTAFSPVVDARGTAAQRRAGRTATTAAPSVRDATRRALVGSVFPSVSVVGTNGSPLAVQSGLGRPTIVVSWPDGCDCRSMLRAVDDVFVTPPRPLAVVGFVLSEDIAVTATEAINAGVLFPTAPDTGGEVARAVGMFGRTPATGLVPQVLVLDADRKVVAVFGRDVTAEQLRGFIRRRFP